MISSWLRLLTELNFFVVLGLRSLFPFWLSAGGSLWVHKGCLHSLADILVSFILKLAKSHQILLCFKSLISLSATSQRKLSTFKRVIWLGHSHPDNLHFFLRSIDWDFIYIYKNLFIVAARLVVDWITRRWDSFEFCLS